MLKIPTYIYSRITGYYSPLDKWNKAKLQEFSERKYISTNIINNIHKEGVNDKLSII